MTAQYSRKESCSRELGSVLTFLIGKFFKPSSQAPDFRSFKGWIQRACRLNRKKGFYTLGLEVNFLAPPDSDCTQALCLWMLKSDNLGANLRLKLALEGEKVVRCLLKVSFYSRIIVSAVFTLKTPIQSKKLCINFSMGSLSGWALIS